MSSAAVLEASYAYCHHVARRAGSSFYPCFLLLPRAKRRAMEALYAFMRTSDDLADNDRPLGAKREAIARWRTALEAALSGECESASCCPAVPEASIRTRAPLSENGVKCATACEPAPEHCLPETISGAPDSQAVQGAQPSNVCCRQAVAHVIDLLGRNRGCPLPALADAVERFAIPPEHLLAVLDGVEMDLEERTYETFDDLALYCHRVASAVGVACIHVWGFSGDRAVELACKCGLAFQLTNILRDLREDASIGRIYLPREDLRNHGYSIEELTGGVINSAFRRLLNCEIERARGLYREGAELIDRLDRDGKRIFGMMLSTYYRLLDQIARRRDEIFIRRIGLSGGQKLRIAARWLLLPPRRSALP